jgi:hypothetical protein
LFFGIGVNSFIARADTESISVSATVGSSPIPPSGGGGGGGGYLMPTSVVFSGSAPSFSKVLLLKDGQLVLITTVGLDSKFSLTLNNGLNNGNYLFSLYGEDYFMRRSKIFNISLYLTRGTTTIVSGILLLPNTGLSDFPIKGTDCFLIADLNSDCKVNLVDFSILKYWNKKKNPPVRVDLNKDRKIDIVDFSIMAYYWTG